ncbi:MAG: Sec-independent protein translocase protein TatB [Neomegalonema sp.]|nr:Sec-independent protein translocase protein TatB [Neomegalonema sp.]
MLDIGGWEIFVILAIALIVVGPKDLPVMIRNVGRWVGKARGLARDFQAGMDEAARQADLDEARKAADISSTLREEGRKIESDLRSDSPTSSTASASRVEPEAPSYPTASSAAPSRPAAEREYRERDRPASSARGASEKERAAASDPRASEDDALLAEFGRGVRNGRGG